MQNTIQANLYRPEILTSEHGAKNLGGMFGLLAAGTHLPLPLSQKPESCHCCHQTAQAIEVIDGKETPIKAGDVLFIPAGEKHKPIQRGPTRFFATSSILPIPCLAQILLR